MRRVLLAVCAVALLGSGLCLGTGCMLQKRRNRRPIDGEAVARIVKGTTTIAQVGALLGSPNEVIWSNGVTTPVDVNLGAAVINSFVAGGKDMYPRAYRYRYTVEKVSGFTVIVFSMLSYDTKYDDVLVFFNEQGVVTHVGVTLDSVDASYNPFGS